MREPPRESHLLRTTTKNEDQNMDQNNGLETRISKEETRTILTMGLREIPPIFIRIFLQDQTSRMGITIRIMKEHMINAQINHSIETMEIDLEMDLSAIRMQTGEIMEIILVFHRPKGEISHKIIHTASQEVINLTILLSADLTTHLQPGLHSTNKNSHKTITTRHLMWFVSL